MGVTTHSVTSLSTAPGELGGWADVYCNREVQVIGLGMVLREFWHYNTGQRILMKKIVIKNTHLRIANDLN